MTTQKLCIDCKWSRRNRFFKLLKTLWCAHPSLVDRVSGKAVTACEEQRTYYHSLWGGCGPDGKLFEKKDCK